MLNCAAPEIFLNFGNDVVDVVVDWMQAAVVGDGAAHECMKRNESEMHGNALFFQWKLIIATIIILKPAT